MNKIYICTNDSIDMDLLMNNIEVKEITSISQEITEELKADRYVFNLNGNYIMGEITAAYLKMKYKIECIGYEIE